MRVAVCDDEQIFRRDFADKLGKAVRSLDLVCDEYESGQDLLRHFDVCPYDIVFLDIEMPGIDGISLARRIREKSSDTYIIFLTSHVEYALKGYEVNALRYLLKPVTVQGITEILDYVEKKRNGGRFLWIKYEGDEIRLALDSIIYIEAANKDVLIICETENYRSRGTINMYDEKLSKEGFFRVHRSYLIQISKIVRISGTDVVMENGDSLPVSRSRMKELRGLLLKFADEEGF